MGKHSVRPRVKKDCTFYVENNHSCSALRGLYCAKEKCKFYRKRTAKLSLKGGAK